MILIGFAVGLVLLAIAVGIWLVLRGRQPLQTSDENLQLGAFAVAYVGTWLALICGIMWLHWRGYVPIGLNLFTGALLGLVPGILGLTHWSLEPLKLAHKETPEEGSGGGCLGLGFLFGSIVLGAVLGLLLGRL